MFLENKTIDTTQSTVKKKQEVIDLQQKMHEEKRREENRDLKFQRFFQEVEEERKSLEDMKGSFIDLKVSQENSKQNYEEELLTLQKKKDSNEEEIKAITIKISTERASLKEIEKKIVANEVEYTTHIEEAKQKAAAARSSFEKVRREEENQLKSLDEDMKKGINTFMATKNKEDEEKKKEISESLKSIFVVLFIFFCACSTHVIAPSNSLCSQTKTRTSLPCKSQHGV